MRISLEMLDMSHQLIRRYQVVRIEKKQVLPSGKPDASILGLRSAGVSLMHIADPRILQNQSQCNRLRFIDRAVVNYNCFPVLVNLLSQAIYRTSKKARIVVARNDYRNLRLSRPS
ncbi:hypothetical protein D3C80_1632070 [compost metagenome]